MANDGVLVFRVPKRPINERKIRPGRTLEEQERLVEGMRLHIVHLIEIYADECEVLSMLTAEVTMLRNLGAVRNG